MKQVLVLGGSGMLGHKLAQVLGQRFSTWVTVRGPIKSLEDYGLVEPERCIPYTDADNFDSVVRAVRHARPDVVVNAIGIVKQDPAANDPIIALNINSLFPHKLARLCASEGARLIHISTDCVFSGRKGGYTEEDVPDAEDLYGRSKLLGEVPQALTLRTSIIGRELSDENGLVEWFLSQRGGRVKGFTQAIFTGLPTVTLAGIIGDVAETHTDLEGVFHVSSDPISKYDLLRLLDDAYGVNVEIEPTDSVRVDRSLDSSKFRERTGWLPPEWSDLAQQLTTDPTPYDEWREWHVRR